MENVMRIDPHTHCRDEEQWRKATIAGTLAMARSQGVGKVFDMPNVKRPVTSAARVMERLALVPPGLEEMYRLYVGLTNDPDQVVEAVRCYDTIDQVVGLKLFAGTSVGGLSVTNVADQRAIYQMLARMGYKGVIAVHCEKEELLRPERWNPEIPFSHTLARPMIAEIESVRDQIEFALDAGFGGWLCICHVSCPESVRLVSAGRDAGLHVACEVTPHHLLWNSLQMRLPDGLLYKMNPPLRPPEAVVELRQQLLDGLIHYVGTDHAPHTEEEKLNSPHLSGYPSLTLYHEFVDGFLPRLGLTPAQTQALTYDNIASVFGNKL